MWPCLFTCVVAAERYDPEADDDEGEKVIVVYAVNYLTFFPVDYF